MKIRPELDGISHINIYSRGKTELGRMLSNFTYCQIKTKDGYFSSVEGYWYWLGIEDCPESEQLKTLSGYKAKEYGRVLKQYKNHIDDPNFEKKILKAILYKAELNKHLFLPEYKNLPFEHYYAYGSVIKDVKDKYPWLIEGIDKIRDYIYESL